jgi:hypothetical protein
MLFYRAALPLSRKTLNYAAGIIRRHLKSIGSRWRKLNPGQQALLVLAYLRKGETFAEVAAGFGVGRTTAWRYVGETVALLAARAPELRQAVREATKAGHAYVILDGTLIPVNRVAADRPFYSSRICPCAPVLSMRVVTLFRMNSELPLRCATSPGSSRESCPVPRPSGPGCPRT